MATITEGLAREALKRCERLQHVPLTREETHELIHAWLDREQMRRALHDSNVEYTRVTAQRDALLEALKSIADCCDEEHAARDYASRQTEIRSIARLAIAAVETNHTGIQS